MTNMTRIIVQSPTHKKKEIAVRNLHVRGILQINETQVCMAIAVNIWKMAKTKLGELTRNYQEVDMVQIAFLRRTWIMKAFVKRKVPPNPHREEILPKAISNIFVS